ncbi:hypothetical protein ACFC0D_00290 [Streptomyces sp. NPDC056222]|uniref:hypothetical protein n=1 Tax=Streptomyces sp. NPDC056222 TaxID=3345749 RepID=UPI0035D63897
MEGAVMLVRTESLPQASGRHMTVRVHTPIGVAVVLWHGDPHEADGRHLVEWTVDDDIDWGENARPTSVAEPGLRQDGAQVVMRGLLLLTPDGAAHLQLGSWPVLFDLASPVPRDRDRTWVEITVGADSVGLNPYET